MRILAAIVTYNRAKLLERCIDHLLGQERAPDEIVVINNSSTDETEDVLRRRDVKFITQPNLGGAGGFNRAIAYSLEEGFDAVWLMDDDGFPDASALKNLSEALVGDVACVSSIVLREDDPAKFVFSFPVLDRKGLPAIFARRRKIDALADLRRLAPDGTYPFAHFFNGALISTDAIRKAGNVDTGYFIFGDEVDYFMRIRKVGRVISHLGAYHYHPDVSRRPLSDMKIYYYIKNTLILNRRYFNRPNLRNVLTVGVALARMTARNGLRNGLSFAVGPQSGVVRKAVQRGLRGQIGNDFNV